MPVRFFTVAFDPKHEVFQDEHLHQFLLNKQINSLRAEFFQANGKAYWTVFVEYEPVLRAQHARGVEALDEPQRLLFQRLREWRRTTADQKGIPAYMIATDNELIAIVQQSPRSLEALKQIRGFGKKKLAQYGQAVLDLIAAFYEKKPARSGKASH